MSVEQEHSTLKVYHDAALRIFTDATVILPKGSKMTVKNVALEAGKSPSSIRKDRDIFIPLIQDIKEMARQMAERQAPGQEKVKDAQQKTKKAKAAAGNYERRYKESLARELMLIRALDEAQRDLRRYEQPFSEHENVYPFPTPKK
ncbi:hypothetical protein A3L25_010270 [Pseudomonas putida]|uniref:Uncharacterized protein n=1 Tax=Pseudomonas putida TaxID=303 RepID=A0AAP9MXT5_PSEPU|nr:MULTISPECIES: hypothetical protein [Pseudomonas]EJT86022.1 hypothetical protein PPS11_01604 [Pseudomonas putida S11]MBP2838640.1 hypothetical protein [Pseudomonas sp. PNP]QJQ09787.1 hypothetical protein A3L25_010270 [Pseudomonas putida]